MARGLQFRPSSLVVVRYTINYAVGDGFCLLKYVRPRRPLFG